MSSQEEFQRLNEIKRQIEGVGFYLANIKVSHEDKKNHSNLIHANKAMDALRVTIEGKIAKARLEANKEKLVKIETNYSDAILNTINRPTAEMKKQAESNLNVKRAFPGKGINIIKTAVENAIRQASERGVAVRMAAEKQNGPNPQLRRGILAEALEDGKEGSGQEPQPGQPV
jgi:hypothetical protein